MKKIRIIALLAAVAMFASLFLILTNVQNSTKQREQESVSDIQKIKVVKAVVNIPPYTTITEDMVEIKEISAEQTFDDFFGKTEDVVGRIAVSDIFQGDVVSPRRIAKEGDVALGLAYSIEEGKRAMTLSVNIEQGVANALKVGNFVDIIFTGSISAEEDETTGQMIPAGATLDSVLGAESPANSQILHNRLNPRFSFIAFQRLKVLALDDKFYKAKSDPVTGNSYASVTLEVTPEQATQLVMLRRSYAADLVLRNQNDDEIVNEPRGEILLPYHPDPDQ